MRVDVQATRRAWRHTVWGTAVLMVADIAVVIYLCTLRTPDYAAVQALLQLLMAMPLLLGVAYLIRRFIEAVGR